MAFGIWTVGSTTYVCGEATTFSSQQDPILWTIDSVHEPTSASLLLLGALLAGGIRRRLGLSSPKL